MAKVHNISELRSLSTRELEQEANSESKAIFEAGFSFDQARKMSIRKHRRQRARILTLLRERQLSLEIENSSREAVVTSLNIPSASTQKSPDRPFFVAHLVGKDREMRVGQEYKLWLERPFASARAQRNGPLLFVPSRDDLRISQPKDAEYIVKVFSDEMELVSPKHQILINKQDPLAVTVRPLKAGRAHLEVLVFSNDSVRLLHTQDVSMRIYGSRKASLKGTASIAFAQQEAIEIATSRLKIKKSLFRSPDETTTRSVAKIHG